MELTRVEQDYLKAINEHQQGDMNKLISLKQLANSLKVASPTVTEAVKRLEKKELLTYESYKGVRLTALGLQEARFIQKAHRVWEYFLLNNLGYQEDDVHDEAENLEHAASRKMIERLYDYLGHPKTCPHGNEIPTDIFWNENSERVSLEKLAIEKRARIIEIPRETKILIQKIGVVKQPNFIKIKEYMPDKSLLVELDNMTTTVLPIAFQTGFIVEVYN